MTQTTIAQPLTIPAQGLRAELGNVVITALYINGAGYKVMARRDGNVIVSQLHTFETDALAAVHTLIAEHAPAPVEPAVERPTVAIPGNVGTRMRVSDPAHFVLAVAATNPNGIVEQGGKLGQATRPQLRSLANKGYLELIHETGRRDARKVIVAGRITSRGRRRLAELTAADRELAEYTDQLAANLAFDTTPTTQLISA